MEGFDRPFLKGSLPQKLQAPAFFHHDPHRAGIGGLDDRGFFSFEVKFADTLRRCRHENQAKIFVQGLEWRTGRAHAAPNAERAVAICGQKSAM